MPTRKNSLDLEDIVDALVVALAVGGTTAAIAFLQQAQAMEWGVYGGIVTAIVPSLIQLLRRYKKHYREQI